MDQSCALPAGAGHQGESSDLSELVPGVTFIASRLANSSRGFRRSHMVALVTAESGGFSADGIDVDLLWKSAHQMTLIVANADHSYRSKPGSAVDEHVEMRARSALSVVCLGPAGSDNLVLVPRRVEARDDERRIQVVSRAE